jgi:hypothetical protein
MPPLHRYFGNPVLSFLGRLFFKTPIRDFHCGLRGFDRAAIHNLNLRTTGMEFASEMVVKASFADLRIAEVPTTLRKDGRSRPPHLRSWRDGWRHLRFLLIFSPRWLYLYPGLILLALGLFLGALLIRGPVNVSPTLQLDIHTFLIAAMFILVGLQAVTLGVIGRRFASRYGFLPPSETFSGVFQWLTLERILIAAVILALGGLAGILWGLGEWAKVGFGRLDVSITMRVLIVAITALVAGLQLMLAGFLASILDVPVDEGRISNDNGKRP